MGCPRAPSLRIVQSRRRRLALRTRIKVVEGVPEPEQLSELDQVGRETVLDGDADDALGFDEGVPAGTTQSLEEVATLRELIGRAENLRGRGKDPKLAIAHRRSAATSRGWI